MQARFGRIIVPVVFLAALCGVALLGAGRASSAPTPAAAVRQLWIPPGTYTGIVVVSTAQRRRWVVALSTNEGKFPIAAPPGGTVVVPFERGWEVRVDDKAHIVVDGVLTNVSTDPASLTDEAAIAITAWGITQNGPVEFVVR